jgi:hypothetical protein
VPGGDGGDDSSDMSDEGLDGMSNLSSEDDGSMYLMDGQVMLVGTNRTQIILSSVVVTEASAL